MEISMHVSCKMLVRDVRLISPSASSKRDFVPFTVVSGVDRETGGDVKFSFGQLDVPYKVMQDVDLEATVIGRLSGFNVSLEVVAFNSPKPK
jgi:hypothetical protein